MAMTTTERNQVAGRFLTVSRSPLVIGCIGSLWADSLTEAQADYILAFCGASGHTFHIVRDYPVSINRSLYNDFIVVEDSLTPERIKHHLDDHGVPGFISRGRIYADTMCANTSLFEEVEDLTGFTRSQLFAWLGY